jgi:hypothetical protein
MARIESCRSTPDLTSQRTNRIRVSAESVHFTHPRFKASHQHLSRELQRDGDRFCDETAGADSSDYGSNIRRSE